MNTSDSESSDERRERFVDPFDEEDKTPKPDRNAPSPDTTNKLDDMPLDDLPDLMPNCVTSSDLVEFPYTPFSRAPLNFLNSAEEVVSTKNVLSEMDDMPVSMGGQKQLLTILPEGGRHRVGLGVGFGLGSTTMSTWASPLSSTRDPLFQSASDNCIEDELDPLSDLQTFIARTGRRNLVSTSRVKIAPRNRQHTQVPGESEPHETEGSEQTGRTDKSGTNNNPPQEQAPAQANVPVAVSHVAPGDTQQQQNQPPLILPSIPPVPNVVQESTNRLPKLEPEEKKEEKEKGGAPDKSLLPFSPIPTPRQDSTLPVKDTLAVPTPSNGAEAVSASNSVDAHLRQKMIQVQLHEHQKQLQQLRQIHLLQEMQLLHQLEMEQRTRQQEIAESAPPQTVSSSVFANVKPANCMQTYTLTTLPGLLPLSDVQGSVSHGSMAGDQQVQEEGRKRKLVKNESSANVSSKSDDDMSGGGGEHQEQKRQKRIMRNRASAQLSRERAKAYMGSLEKQLAELQSMKQELTVQMQSLIIENHALKMEACVSKGLSLGSITEVNSRNINSREVVNDQACPASPTKHVKALKSDKEDHFMSSVSMHDDVDKIPRKNRSKNSRNPLSSHLDTPSATPSATPVASPSISREASPSASPTSSPSSYTRRLSSNTFRSYTSPLDRSEQGSSKSVLMLSVLCLAAVFYGIGMNSAGVQEGSTLNDAPASGARKLLSVEEVEPGHFPSIDVSNPTSNFQSPVPPSANWKIDSPLVQNKESTAFNVSLMPVLQEGVLHQLGAARSTLHSENGLFFTVVPSAGSKKSARKGYNEDHYVISNSSLRFLSDVHGAVNKQGVPVIKAAASGLPYDTGASENSEEETASFVYSAPAV